MVILSWGDIDVAVGWRYRTYLSSNRRFLLLFISEKLGIAYTN
jgi:hypothetical protein